MEDFNLMNELVPQLLIFKTVSKECIEGELQQYNLHEPH
jgi:hypothetical protein